MTIYATMRSTAKDLFDKYGSQTLTLQKTLQEVYDVTTGKAPQLELDTEIYTFHGVLETNPESAEGISSAFSLQSGDVIVYVVPGELSVIIEVGDLILIGAEEFKVISVNPPYSDDTVVIKMVQIRQRAS